MIILVYHCTEGVLVSPFGKMWNFGPNFHCVLCMHFMHVYVTIHYMFEYYALSAAVLMLELDNEEQHILICCV